MLGLIAISMLWVHASWRFLGLDRHTCKHVQSEDEWREYSGESVKWKLCGNITGHDVECGTIYVPMDQFSEDKSLSKNFSIPLIRMRGKNATKNLMLNPGGPGGSGSYLIYSDGEPLNTILGEEFHLVSFDPRGVNESRPLASCYPDNETRKRLRHGPLKDPIKDSPNLHAWTANFVQSCKDNMGEYLQYINTAQTAADMNSILDALGQEKMLYWGFSYGTILGQVYATMYPERSERIVIDGVANQFQWFNDLISDEDFFDTNKVYHGFFDECVKAGDACPLSKFAKTAPELAEKTTRFINNLRSKPLSVYVNTTINGVLDDYEMWYDGIFRELYRPKNWPQLADRLAKLLDGNATDAFIAYGQGDTFSSLIQGESNQLIHLNDCPTGPKHWRQDRLDLLEKLLPFFDANFFARTEQELYYMKQQWDIPSTNNYTPKRGVVTAHPLLVVSTTYDPVCPLVSAQGARDAFNGSRIIEVKGYGHCSLAKPSVCAGKYIRDYLSTGALPDTDVQCEIDGNYFPGEGDNDAAFDKEKYSIEDLELLAAQTKLSSLVSLI